ILSARPAPAGFTPVARSADAQRVSELLGAEVTLWVEHEEPLRLCAYSRRGNSIHEAPLPAPLAALDPAVFAAVAGSVVLEALRATPSPSVELAPPAVAAAPTPGPAEPAPAAPIAPSPPPEPQRPSPAEPSSWSKRFFVRAGVAVGFAGVTKRTPADRDPPQYRVEEAFQVQKMSGDPDAADKYLQSTGYSSCDISGLDGDGSMVTATDCEVSVVRSGVGWTSAIDLAAGINLSPLVALAVTARIDPTVGRGPMAHALLGLQVEAALRQAKVTGFWLSAALGLSGGQIQVRPPSQLHDTPYTRSGLFGVRAGLLFGYRFLPRLGIVATPVFHSLFPDILWALETNLSLEVRI
ncbi:MAG TPA: hypothetical protein VJU61_05915, partial [Polyangiaceae bacterium]|nr:hypothetical protein [Polyangiaceae bacterium]